MLAGAIYQGEQAAIWN